MSEQIRFNKEQTALYGEKSERVYLYIHGKNGRKEDAAAFAETACANGFQVLSIDLPNRADCKPWEALPVLESVMRYAKSNWREISLYAVSIGAWFSMLAFRGETLRKCMFVSPVLDMKLLIENMMKWSGVTESELQSKKLIATDFGETLDWEYFQFAKENSTIEWGSQTAILYPENDDLTSRTVAEEFCVRFGCSLTVAGGCEHWFHTEEQLFILRKWESDNLR